MAHCSGEVSLSSWNHSRRTVSSFVFFFNARKEGMPSSKIVFELDLIDFPRHVRGVLNESGLKYRKLKRKPLLKVRHHVERKKSQ